MSKRQETLNCLDHHRLVAVVRTDTAAQALAAARAVLAGGMKLVEITFTVPEAAQVIAQLAQEAGADALVGAGTVMSTQQGQEAIAAGARFIVSPTFVPELLPICQQADVVCIPGAMTPTEIVTAWQAGADLVKVFPINLVGGPAYIKTVREPLPDAPLLVSGGVTLQDFPHYLALGVRCVALGGDLMPQALVEQGDYQGITRNARRFVEALAAAKA